MVDADLRRKAQEVDPVFAREVCDGRDLPFFPEHTVGEAGYIAHMDARANDAAALADCSEREWHESADGGEDYGGTLPPVASCGGAF